MSSLGRPINSLNARFDDLMLFNAGLVLQMMPTIYPTLDVYYGRKWPLSATLDN